MNRDEELELIGEIIGLVERKSAWLDADVAHSPIPRYSSPERHEREKAMILRCVPIAAARSDDLTGPGSFRTMRLSGLPILMTRDAEERAHVFLNVCRHRGARLERGEEGCKRVFTCPYHGWSWTGDGALRAVPHGEQGFPGLPRAERGLRRLPSMEAHGFIWIVANPDMSDIPDIGAWLGRLAEDFEWLELADHETAATEVFEIAANWKLLVEGGLEAYHFRVAHAATIAPYFPDNLSTYRMFGPHIRSVLPRITLPELADKPDDGWAIRREANILYSLMPTTQLLVQQDHIVWIRMDPLSEDRTAVRMSTLAPKGMSGTADRKKHWERNHAITRATLMEDFTLGEEIQSGFASRGNPSHLFGRFEGALNRFNLLVEELIAG